ncbi:hypothetical protein M8J77_009151 [Diaphorina citri]|nr:hypothetical protein M8J77_009151 [Diaphorina citri]
MSGVLCDKRISPKNKGYMYKTVVRPTMLYGAETWPIKKRQEERMNVAEMRMLRWMCGVTRMDRIRNTRIRGTVKVTEISRKIQERRLQWFGHVERRDQEHVGKRLRDMEVGGKRDRGRPRMRYMYGQSETGFEREEVGSEPRPKPRRMEEVDSKCRPYLSGKRRSKRRRRVCPDTGSKKSICTLHK